MPKVHRCRYSNCHAVIPINSYYCERHKEYEVAYIESRKKWNNKSKGYDHKYNHEQRNRNEVKRNQYAFYRSKLWVALRRRILDRDKYLCQYCLASRQLTPNSKTVDHIIPVEVDIFLKAEENNLATICRSCHALKTRWEQSYYGTGKNNQLKPVKKNKRY